MFIAYVNQTDNGCDHAIACGKTLWKLKATTREEALAELKQKVLGTFYRSAGYWEEGYYGEDKLASMALFEVSAEEAVPLSQWYEQAAQASYEARQRREEAIARVQYEELKKRFAAREETLTCQSATS